MSDQHGPPLRLTPQALFAAFFRAGLMGFGGVLPMARRVLVEERRWLSAEDFTELLALCQFLPGANVANLSVILGSRTCGLVGSAAALLGLLGAPIVIVLVLAALYARFGAIPAVSHLVTGLSAGAAGLMLATAVKIARPLRTSAAGLLVAGTTFAALGLLRLPFIASLAVLAPASILLVWAVRRR